MTVQKDSDNRNIVVVLGAGRSGTSLVMHLLEGAGMRVSSNLVSARFHNPEGPMEDLSISKLYDEELLPLVGGNRLLPFPIDLASSMPDFASIQYRLKEILLTNINDGSVFGFKDPYTSCLLPIWFMIFNQCSITPRFILCVRNPATVSDSREKSFGQTSSISELAWLNNNVCAIRDTGADIFIVHYEQLLRSPTPIVKKLLDYCGLNNQLSERALSNLIKRKVKQNLNRSSSVVAVKNPAVLKLYKVLKTSHGSDFDREALKKVVEVCGKEMSNYNGWCQLAYKANKIATENRKKLAIANEKIAKLGQLEVKVKELELAVKKQEELEAQIHRLRNQMTEFLDFES